MPDDSRPQHPKTLTPTSKPTSNPSDTHHASDPADGAETLDENKRLNASGLSWDETTPKPGESFNRATEMGEAD